MFYITLDKSFEFEVFQVLSLNNLKLIRFFLTFVINNNSQNALAIYNGYNL